MKTLSGITFIVGIVVPALSAFVLSAVYATGFFHAQETSLMYFTELVENTRFLKSLGYTFLLATAVVVSSTFTALKIAQLLNRRMEIPSWFLLPFAIPPVVAAFFGFHLFSGVGLLSRIAHALGLISTPVDFPALVNDPFGIGTFASHFMLCMPFFLVYFIYLRNQPLLEQLEDTARALGASQKQVWHHIARPTLLHKSTPLLLVFFVFVLGTYEIPLLLGSQSVRAVVPVIVDQIKGYNLKAIPTGYAMALAYSVIIMLVAAVLSKKMNRQHGA
ncbi:MAG: ABC transporter permease subunit [Cryomorphaceae bacterium]|nr:ABC transporter permease subunit [Cryomorphaceae bacterium]